MRNSRPLTACIAVFLGALVACGDPVLERTFEPAATARDRMPPSARIEGVELLVHEIRYSNQWVELDLRIKNPGERRFELERDGTLLALSGLEYPVDVEAVAPELTPIVSVEGGEQRELTLRFRLTRPMAEPAELMFRSIRVDEDRVGPLAIALPPHP